MNIKTDPVAENCTIQNFEQLEDHQIPKLINNGYSMIKKYKKSQNGDGCSKETGRLRRGT